MSTQLIIRIDPDTKNKLYKLARQEGKTTSQMVRELIDDYIKDRDIGAYINDLWKRIGGKLKSNNIKPDEIEKAIKETREKAK